MFLTIIGPVGHREERVIDSMGLSLGTMFKDGDDIDVRINGASHLDWKDFIPDSGDRVEIRGDTGAWVIPIIISMIISMALSQIVKALTPKPKKPKLDSNRTEAFGIAGFQNTTGRGTPAFVPYGLNRVWGHVLSSGATLSPDGSQMYGKILYFMGDTGGDGIESISNILLDGTSISQFEEIQVQTRMGLDVQSVIPEFENNDNLRFDGRPIGFIPDTGTATPIIYTTFGSNIQRATLFIQFPSGLFYTTKSGNQHIGGVLYKIEIKLTSSGTWIELPWIDIRAQSTSGFTRTHQIDFPSAGKWDIRITVMQWGGWTPDVVYVADSILFNVQETVFTTKTYPGWALLALTNIPAKKVRSLDNMNVSALVEGKRVKVWNGSSHHLQDTQKRCGRGRDMMTHPVVGMGSEIEESEIDDDQWLESQNYYDESVAGHNGNETRDIFNIPINDRELDWEWVKKVAGECRGRIIPSGLKWKYVIDRPDTPNLLYTEGANVIDGSVSIEISLPDKAFTEITAQFRDEDQDYEDNFSPPIKDPDAVSVVPETQKFDTITRESEVQRENMIAFKRNFLERRRWQFSSPQGAIVSEVMDLDYFAERGIGNEGAYGGILLAGSSTFTVYLPDVIILKPSTTYAIIVTHRQTNITEYRIVNTAAGTWGALTVATPFATAPVEGDAFSVGEQDIEHIVTRAQELEIDKDGRVKQVRTEYIPAVYTQDPLPPKSARRFFNLESNRAPIPLRDANVQEVVSLNTDG